MIASSFSRLICAFVTGSAIIAYSQPAPTLAPPAAPFVAIPQSNTSWSIKVSHEDAVRSPQATAVAPATPSSPHPEDLNQITVQKDQKMTRIVATYSNGKKQEGYLIRDHFAVRSTMNTNEAVVMEAAKGKNGSLEIFTTDFPGTQWIDLPYYRGVEKLAGRLCYVFSREPDTQVQASVGDKSSIAPPPLSFIPLNYMPLKAYVDAETKLPIRVQLGPTTYEYSAITPWSGTITMPSTFINTAKEFSRQADILQKLRAKNSSRN